MNHKFYNNDKTKIFSFLTMVSIFFHPYCYLDVRITIHYSITEVNQGNDTSTQIIHYLLKFGDLYSLWLFFFISSVQLRFARDLSVPSVGCSFNSLIFYLLVPSLTLLFTYFKTAYLCITQHDHAHQDHIYMYSEGLIMVNFIHLETKQIITKRKGTQRTLSNV